MPLGSAPRGTPSEGNRMAENKLYYGDNLDILRRYVADESVDLVYLDPPFKSDQDYNVLFAERDGRKASAQIQAFGDTWTWDMAAERAYLDVVESGGAISQAMQGLRSFLGPSDMLAYLSMMAPRLTELRRALKATGALYLHCDPTASHYLKIILDAVFGPACFRNEIIWKRTTAHSSAKKFAPVHDTILYYSRTTSFTWNEPRAGYEDAYLERYYRFDDGDGRLYWRADLTAAGVRSGASGQEWRGFNPTSIGRHWALPVFATADGLATQAALDRLDEQGRIYWPARGKKVPQFKRYRDELKGKAVADLWDDIARINPVSSERLGYPTQKPQALLERIIAASSNSGDVVLDPFCGCGTTIGAAQSLGRRWIGVDITHLAIGLIRSRLSDTFGPEIRKTYQVVGEPVSHEDAAALAGHDRYQFQFWALGLVNARPAASDEKRGADKGIDGRLFFHDEAERTGKTKQIILSVKSGSVQARDVRDLCAVVDREHAQIGALLTLEEPTRDMRKEAAGAGFYELPGRGRFPKIQILTIAELLEGKQIEYPHWHSNVTLRRAPKADARLVEETQGALPLLGGDGVVEPDRRRKPAKRKPPTAPKLVSADD